MLLTVICPEGHEFHVKKEHAGRRVRCPECDAAVTVPGSVNSAGSSRTQRKSAEKVTPDAGKSGPPPILLIGAGGVVLLFVALLGAAIWLATRSRPEPPAQNLTAQNRVPDPKLPPPASNPIPPPSVAPVAAGHLSEVPPTGGVATKAGAETGEGAEGGLIRLPTDPRVEAFRLPGSTWAFAYDELSGRVAITQDDLGFVIYDLDDLARGSVKPVGIIATEGRPMSVCWKPLADRRVFVCSSESRAGLRWYDVESLNLAGEMPLEGLRYARYVTASSNPQDPHVYFVHQQAGQPGEDAQDRETADRVGRVNLLTKVQDPSTATQHSDLVASADGSMLYLRPNSTANGIITRWEEGTVHAGLMHLKRNGEWARNSRMDPVVPLIDRVALGHGIAQPSFGKWWPAITYAPCLEFRKAPLIVGMDANGIVVASANTLKALDTIPLPDLGAARGVSDPRARYEVSRYSAFFEADGDDTRSCGVLCFSDRLILVPIERLQLRPEPSLRARQSPPATVTVGAPVEVALQWDTPGVKVEIIPETPRQGQSEESPAGRGPRIQLAAAMNMEQTLLFLAEVEALRGIALPFKIKVGDEVMTVTAIDDFRGALTVQRTKQKPHGVSERIAVVTEEAPPEKTVSLPVVEGTTFRWTPGADQVGSHTIHLRATLGDLTHEWYWSLRVQQDALDLPFYLVGVEPEPGTGRAVVWGQTVRPKVRVRGQGEEPELPPDGTKFYLGVFDLKGRQLLRHVEVPFQIGTAALHSTGVYASFNREPPTVRGPEVPSEIVRLNPDTLAVEEGKAMAPTHVERITVIGNRFLAAHRGRSSPGTTYRFAIPSLEPAAPPLEPYPVPGVSIAGRVGDGFLWDGVLWDAALKNPQLLVFPVHFSIPNERSGGADFPGPDGSVIHCSAHGSHVCTWARGSLASGQTSLTGRPARLDARGGQLLVYSHANTSRFQVLGNDPKPDASLRLMDALAGYQHEPGNRGLQSQLAGYDGYASEADGQVTVAMQGKLFIVPLEGLLKPEPAFRFVEKQDDFVLSASRRNTLKYSAPGATKYTLRYWYDRPDGTGFEENPVETLDSDNGVFQLQLQDAQQLVGRAFSMAVAGKQKSERQRAIDTCLKAFGPPFRSLTGRQPAGVPVPLYVTVIASHPDGNQQAGLAHCYLVEVPLAQVRNQLKAAD